VKKFVAGIGESDFRTLRESGFDIVDKTFFICDVLADSSKVLLFPRPRRFGKTTNLSMLGHFLRKTDDDLSSLFAGLAVSRDPKTMAHFQKYPVLLVTFKDVKAETFEETFAAIKGRIVSLFDEHRYLLESKTIGEHKRAYFQRVLLGEPTKQDIQDSLLLLSQALYEHHGQRVVILIDEYDTPVLTGYMNGYFDEVVSFFRTFLSACLKDNTALFKGVLTGILRVARESMFSDLNHIDVYSIIDKPYSTAFGFTEAEVEAIIEPEAMPEVRLWYNGYIFGDNVIYNPWSILHYIKRGVFDTYWVNTASSALIDKLAMVGGLGLSEKSSALLNGETIEVEIDRNIVLRDVERMPDAFWNFLLFSGYLKIVEVKRRRGTLLGKLAIPNIEVGEVYRSLFRNWLHKMDPTWGGTRALVQGLLTGDSAMVQEQLQRILLTAMSFQDPAGAEPEKLYHGLVLGLLVHLEEEYEVRSNRESGLGRADVLMRPKTAGRPGVVIEFKVQESRKTVDEVLLSAAKQVRDKHYATDLLAAGANPVYEYVMLFDGKIAWVKRVDELLGSLEPSMPGVRLP